jgi:sugar lactone lactonase YvrE
MLGRIVLVRMNKPAAILMTTLLSASAVTARAHPGIGIVSDSRGNVFYTDLHQVLRIDTSGHVSVAVPGVHTHELFIDGRDNLFGEHLWYEGDETKQWGHRVWKLTPDGVVVDVVPAKRGFRTEFEFVQDAGGNQYWVGDDTGDAAKTRTTLFSRGPSGARRLVTRGFVNARWIAADPDGTVYVVDDRRIKRVSPHGLVRIASPRLASGIIADFIGGITTDRRGVIYVANFGASRVDRIDADGRLTVFERSGARFGPCGVLVRERDVWVLEFAAIDAVRVRRFAPDGTLKGTYSK